MMIDPRIIHNVLMLTPKEWFLFGAACLVALCWLGFFIAPRVLRLALDGLSWCEAHLGAEPPDNLVNFDDHRRRLELGAAFTAVDDVRRAK